MKILLEEDEEISGAWNLWMRVLKDFKIEKRVLASRSYIVAKLINYSI